MESQNTVHQASPKPTAQRDLGTDFVLSSDEQAPVRVSEGDKSRDMPISVQCFATQLEMVSDSQQGSRGKPLSMKCFETQLEMVSDSQQGNRGINFKPTLNYQQHLNHLPLSSTTYRGSSSSSPFKSAKAMNAEFYRCLRSGQIDSLKRMLEDEENNFLDQVTPQQNTALHIVARQGLDQLIKPILTRRLSLLGLQNVNGDTALHVAAEAGHLASVVSIVEFAGDADRGDLCETENKDDKNALHVAVRRRHTKVATFLIKVHPKASCCLNGRGESPLFVAAELGELQIVKDMISMFDGTDVQSSLEEGKSIVQAAISGGNSGVLETILSKYKSLFNSTVISLNGVNKLSTTPLSYAAFKGNIQMVRYRLSEFPDSAYKGDLSGVFPIHKAAAEGHKMVLKEFLRLYPDSRELLTLEGENILHKAALHGKDDVVSYILGKPDLDELINAKDKKGNTPLHYAVAAKFPKVVDALTWDKRVRLDLVNNDGMTAMDMAMSFEIPVPSLKEQLTWLALRYAGAQRRNFQQAKRRSNESEQATVENYKDRVNTLSVVATLVTTMSFAAGFTMPGGNIGSDPDLGMANFLKRRIFQLFVISNSIALYTSVLDVLVLIFAMLGDVKMLQVSLKFAVPLLATSLATMSIGFMSAVYLVVSSLRWLGIVIWVLGSVFLAVVMALFFLLFPPLSAKNRFTRHLAYLPFRAMLYICERK